MEDKVCESVTHPGNLILLDLPRHVGQTDLPDVLGGRGELGSQGGESEAVQWGNVVGEVVLEEVPALLPVHGEHGHHVTGVHPVPEELESHPGRCFQFLRIWCGRQRQSDDDVLGASEDPGVAVVPHGPPLGLSHHAHRVDVLGAVVVEDESLLPGHLISLLPVKSRHDHQSGLSSGPSPEGGTHALREDAGHLSGAQPVGRGRVLHHVLHDLRLLVCSRELQVLCSVDRLAGAAG